MAMNSIVSMYQVLIKEWNKKPVNLETTGKLLTGLKVALTEFHFMPITRTSPSPQELVLARDVLEIGVQWSVLKQDIPSFERYIAQLKCYYFDYSSVLQESPYMYQLLGLNLMCLLAQNRLAEFHTELELLPPKEMQESVYIRCPMELEQYLMEGNYNKVFLAKGNVPAEGYLFFIGILIDTLRNEVAECLTKAYSSISAREAMRMLFFQKETDMKQFADNRSWKIDSNSYYHFKSDAPDTHTVPALKLIQQSLGYARELERIV